MRTLMLFSLAWALALPRALTAQTPLPEPGSRVRVWTRLGGLGMSAERKVGRILAVRADTLLLGEAERGDSLLLLVPQIVRLEISRGRRTHRTRGALIGLAAGASLGAFAGYLSGDDPPRTAGFLSGDLGGPSTAAEKAVVTGVAFGLVGSLVGVIVGWRRTDDWADVPLDRVTLSIAPGPSEGVGLSVAAQF